MFNTSRKASTVKQGSDSREKFQQGRRTGRSQLQLPESQPLLHVSSSMDNEPMCLVLEDQPEHSNRTRNSLLNCLNLTPLNLTCHSNLIP